MRGRIGDQAHRGEIHVEVLQSDVGVLLADPRHRLPPELRHLEHVRLVHRGHQLPPRPRRLEGDPRHALDLRHGVAECVDRLRRRRAPAARRSRAPRAARARSGDPPPRGDRRGAARRDAAPDAPPRAGGWRTPEQLPERQQPGLGAPLSFGRGERGMAHGAEQHGIRLDHGVSGATAEAHRRPRATPAAPMGYSAVVERDSRRDRPRRASTRTASAVTSGPMPSPGSTATVNTLHDGLARRRRRSKAAMRASCSSVLPISSRPAEQHVPPVVIDRERHVEALAVVHTARPGDPRSARTRASPRRRGQAAR